MDECNSGVASVSGKCLDNVSRRPQTFLKDSGDAQLEEIKKGLASLAKLHSTAQENKDGSRV